jgi:serine/threonine protein kinase
LDETISECYGITKDPSSQDYMLILQYANMKSLNDSTTLKNFSSSLSWTEKKELFQTIVQAIKLLHESNLIHKNLHLGNILLNRTYSGSQLIQNVYISDIEMCRSINEQRQQSSKLFGVMPFIAPEVLKGERQVKSSNIYSLGIILWCIISGQLPYTNFSHDSFLAHEICKGKRPMIPNGTPKDIVEILNQCWESDPSKRPSIHTIAFSLNWSVVSDGESIDYNSNDLYKNPNAFYSRRLIDFNFKSFDKVESYL